MGEIVQSLFGPSPDEIRMQQMQAMDAQSRAFAQMTPQERATYGISQGAGMLGGQLAESMGMVNPAMQQAQQRDAALQGLDVSDPQSILQRASQIQDPRLKTQLIMLAQQQQAAIDESKLKQAQVYKYMTPDAPADTRTSDMKEAADMADRAGFVRGTPEWNKEYMKNMVEARKGKGTNITNVLPGGEKAIDIPKFRSQVQDTIKPYIVTTDAADTSLSMLDLAIKQNNPTAYQGSRVQLAKAFGDSNITGAEIKAAGGDPSIWGSLKDFSSTLFTSTPSKETMYAMKRTLTALKKVSETKGRKEIDIQKRIAKGSGISDSDIENIFDFPQFGTQSNSPITETITLSNGKKVTVTVIQ